MRSLVIHLKSNRERRYNVARLRAELPDARVVDGIDGRDPGPLGEVTVSETPQHAPHWPGGLSEGEIGRFLSHRKCWAMIVENGWDHALIAEDDAGLDLSRRDGLQTLLIRNAGPERYIRIPPAAPERIRRTVDREGTLRLCLPRTIGTRSTLQLVGRAAATRLLETSKAIDRPLERFIQMHWVTGQQVLAVVPPVSLELWSPGNSAQRTAGGLAHRLRRDWSEAAYSARIAARPQA